MWNTGCNRVANALQDGLSILDNENHHLAISVASKSSADWKSTIFPWCSSNTEVKSKAFVASSTSTGKAGLYLFQNYNTNAIYWSVDLNNPWDNKQPVTKGYDTWDAREPESDLDIFILPDRVFGVPAEDENQTFTVVFNDVKSALGVAIAIGGIVATAL